MSRNSRGVLLEVDGQLLFLPKAVIASTKSHNCLLFASFNIPGVN